MSIEKLENYYDEVTEENEIKTVAIYARKSRAEEGEKDLNKHLMRLRARCELNQWDYEVYKEIGSGASIQDRPKMIELLEDVNIGKFDAVVVVDIDRLSRGKGGDLDRIIGTFRNSGVKIVQESPYQVYDLRNSDHIQTLELKMFLGNMELMQVKKRFKEGKRLSRYLGKWVNGQAPLGYHIDKKTKHLAIDEKESEIIYLIKKWFFEGQNTVDIAWNLNRKEYKKRSGNLFNPKSISRILQNEVYTGTTIYNKSMGNQKNSNNLYSSGLPYKRFDKSEWKRKYNTHPALITFEEFEEIKKMFKERRSKPIKRSISTISGLCYTPEGEKYKIAHYDLKTKKPSSIKIERGKYEDKSNYKQIPIKIVESVILQSLKMLEEELVILLEDKNNDLEIKQLTLKAKNFNKEISNLENEIEKVEEGFLSGLFDVDQAKKVKDKKNKEIDIKENELLEVNRALDNLSNSTNISRLDRIQNLYKKIEKAEDPEKLNMLYKSIIDKIIISRTTKDEIDIKVNFL